MFEVHKNLIFFLLQNDVLIIEHLEDIDLQK